MKLNIYFEKKLSKSTAGLLLFVIECEDRAYGVDNIKR